MPDKNEPPSEAEIQDALHHADIRGRFCHPFCEQSRMILARALRSEREKAKQIEAETWEKAAKLSETWMPVCHSTGHDERWCGNCSAMETGIDLFGQELASRAKALRSTPPEVKP